MKNTKRFFLTLGVTLLLAVGGAAGALAAEPVYICPKGFDCADAANCLHGQACPYGHESCLYGGACDGSAWHHQACPYGYADCRNGGICDGAAHHAPTAKSAPAYSCPQGYDCTAACEHTACPYGYADCRNGGGCTGHAQSGHHGGGHRGGHNRGHGCW